MNWFRQNKFLGSFLAVVALATLLAGYFLLHAKGLADDEQARLETTVAELNRLRGSVPFPSEPNLKKSRAQVEKYRNSLGALEEKLKARTLPLLPLQPNEFKAQLRQAVTGVLERASASKVRFPENFFLGFDEYATSLPNPVAAPRLGQELRALELLLNGIVDARVDALGSLTRTPLPEEKTNPAATPNPAKTRAGPRAIVVPSVPVVMRAVEISFSGSPAAVRRVLNQVSTAPDQLFIVRSLQIKNQVDKGPKREIASGPAAVPAERGTAQRTINFIVGSEHLDVTAKLDVIDLTSPTRETP